MRSRIKDLTGLVRGLQCLAQAMASYHRRQCSPAAIYATQQLLLDAAKQTKACSYQWQELLAKYKIDNPADFALRRVDLLAKQSSIVARHLAASPAGRRRLARSLGYPTVTANTNGNASGEGVQPDSLKKHRSASSSADDSGTRQKSAPIREKPSSPTTDRETRRHQTVPALSPRSQPRRVPASRLGRLASFGGLAVGLGLGTASELARRAIGQESAQSSASLLTPANADRIVSTLCRVRGAALKLGQMVSLQDEALVDPRLLDIFDRVRRSADFMPTQQTHRVLGSELGSDWRQKFAEFNDKPFAAASIGQVHYGRLSDGQEVAVKVQYPGVADSIESDIENLMHLLRVWQILPAGLYADSAIAVARRELAWECDYQREAECSERFRKLLSDCQHLSVPRVLPDLSTRRVLTTDFVSGLQLDECIHLADQAERDWLGSTLLSLCLRELFEFRFMQTDPNWANFLYQPAGRDSASQRLVLLDFGASREYAAKFVDNYLRVIYWAAERDHSRILRYSQRLGFLTGFESAEMNQAHTDAVLALGEPFASEGLFDFGQQSTTRTIHGLIPTMLRHRLTPPPEESYSLHRKLSGAFLLCARLRSRIACRPMLRKAYEEYRFTEPE
ncbi:hypothetical protein BOX15_Mlig011779g1 [Macrostomum lignano]|uniref:Uncharacterized protein n=2 Tax=Macrostomum lignano TaxID=282301 RepID=A0A267E525_9PLAT|nr:hypothetical protein BOX15_Mlig011779g1 [Macrostomum lignano]